AGPDDAAAGDPAATTTAGAAPSTSPLVRMAGAPKGTGPTRPTDKPAAGDASSAATTAAQGTAAPAAAAQGKAAPSAPAPAGGPAAAPGANAAAAATVKAADAEPKANHPHDVRDPAQALGAQIGSTDINPAGATSDATGSNGLASSSAGAAASPGPS